MPEHRDPPSEDDLRLREYEHAWTHYRHLESLRARHLGFLFSVSFAALAFLGTRTHLLDRPWRAAGAAGVLILVNLLATLTYIDVKKIGIALAHNRAVVNAIREQLLPEPGDETPGHPGPADDRPSGTLLGSRLFTVHGTAVLTCLIAAIASSGGIAVLTVHFLLTNASAGPRAILVAAAAASVGLVITVVSVGDRPYWTAL